MQCSSNAKLYKNSKSSPHSIFSSNIRPNSSILRLRSIHVVIDTPRFAVHASYKIRLSDTTTSCIPKCYASYLLKKSSLNPLNMFTSG